jgi:chemotaxis protein histidine kinase CheA
MLDKLEEIKRRYTEVEAKLGDPSVIADMRLFKKLNIEYKGLQPVVEAYYKYKQITDNINGAKEVLATEKDKDFLDLPEDFEFKGTEDSLKEALEVSKTRIAEKTRENIVAGFQDFVYKNLEQIQNTYNTVDFEQVDLSDEATQKEVVKYYLKKTTKFKDEQIEKKVNQLEQFAELEDEAKTALDELKVLDKEEKAQLARQAADYEVAQAKARQDADKLFRKTLKETDEVSGIKINKDRVFNSLYNTIKLEDGTVTTSFNKNLQEVLSDPTKTIFLAHLLENNFELNKIEDTKVNTKAAKVLKEKLRQAGLSSSAKTRGGDLSKPGKLSLEDFS